METEDLIKIYCSHLRSHAEYCSVVFHDSLTDKQSNAIERAQRVSLKVILGDSYIDYSSAMEMAGLDSLLARRDRRALSYGLKSITHPVLKRHFPLNTALLEDEHDIRNRELFNVNFARTERYRNSAIPAIQRRLNEHYS